MKPAISNCLCGALVLEFLSVQMVRLHRNNFLREGEILKVDVTMNESSHWLFERISKEAPKIVFLFFDIFLPPLFNSFMIA